MISAIILFSANGELLLQRFFRDDVNSQNIEAFRLNVLMHSKNGAPVTNVDRVNFLYTRSGGLYLVAASKKNCDATMVFHFLYSLIQVLQSYTGDANLDANSVKNNAFLIYELLDEMLDNGYPQISQPEILKNIIQLGGAKLDASTIQKHQRNAVTQMVTGAVTWRQPNKHFYRKNEVYIDVLEKINVIMAKGQVLNAYVTGKLQMKTKLSGMPTCTFGLNDKISNATNNARNSRHPTINIDQLRFHQCVQLNKFSEDRSISFIPPDDEFELADYRVSDEVSLPFHVYPNIVEKGRARVEYEVSIKSNFDSKTLAQDVIIRLPCPTNAAKHNFKVIDGKTKYDAKKHCIEWTIKRFPPGQTQYRLKGEVTLAVGIRDQQWARPPITLEFTIPMWTASDLSVRYLKVQEPSGYQTIKWVRYITKAGLYEIRI